MSRKPEWRRRRGEPEAWGEEQDDVYDEDGLAWEWDERTALEAYQKGLVVPCVIRSDIRMAATVMEIDYILCGGVLGLQIVTRGTRRLS